ncbi:MAG: hypothetical protein NTV07_07295 [Candidatus Omnitrophica bacterium]|nr:hypothetical protein [Candidatus Omnitrophota bacterium]
MKKIFVGTAVFMMLLSCAVSFAQEAKQEVSKDQVIAIATEAVKAKGLDLEAVNIVYDEGGQLWSEKIGAATLSDQPNHGILVQGFLKNYKVVYFDYKEPLPDVWVFVDKDTGDVLTVYTEQ